MKSLRMIFAVAVLLGAMLLSENAQAGGRVYVRMAPPKAKVVVVKPKPHRHDAIWVAGYWSWSGKKHIWRAGRYIDPRPNYDYVPGHWAHDRHGWYWEEGHWSKR